MSDQAGDGQVPDPTGQGPDDQSANHIPELDGPYDEARALKMISKLRGFEKHARELEKRLKDYEARERESEEAKLSESQRLQKEVARLAAERDAAKRDRQDALNRQQVLVQAQRLGAVDPDVVAQLLPWSQIDHAEDGTPRDLDKHVRQLLKDKPYLTAAPPPGVSVGNPPTARPQAGQQIFTRSQIKSYDFYQNHREEIMQAMRENRIIDD